jgi:hypothetical protein
MSKRKKIGQNVQMNSIFKTLLIFIKVFLLSIITSLSYFYICPSSKLTVLKTGMYTAYVCTLKVDMYYRNIKFQYRLCFYRVSMKFQIDPFLWKENV